MDHFCWPCCAQLLQACLTLYDPEDYTPPGSCAHRILQSRILEWVPMPSFRWSSQPRDWPQVSWMQADSWSHLGIHELSTTAVRTSHTPPGTTHTHRHTHTCVHTHTHTHRHTHTQAHTHTHSRHWPSKLCYFYVFHPSSLATLIKLEFDTTPIDKIRL